MNTRPYEIQITLKLHGNQGFAEGGGEAVTERTQALALSQLVKKPAKNKDLKGKPWRVIGHPELRGTV